MWITLLDDENREVVRFRPQDTNEDFCRVFALQMEQQGKHVDYLIHSLEAWALTHKTNEAIENARMKMSDADRDKADRKSDALLAGIVAHPTPEEKI